MSLGVTESPLSWEKRKYTLFRSLRRLSILTFQKCSLTEDGSVADARSKNGLAVGSVPAGNAARSGCIAGTACERASALSVHCLNGTKTRWSRFALAK